MFEIKIMGQFTIKTDHSSLSEDDNRLKKIWLLLSYLLMKNGEISKPEQILSDVWGEDPSITNPKNALKTTIHRLRAMLDLLGDGMGNRLIRSERGGYRWASELPHTLDIDTFDILAASKSREDHLKALDLYDEILPALNDAPWIKEPAKLYHRRYMNLAKDCQRWLLLEGRCEEAIAAGEKAIRIEPLDESLYAALMEAYLAADDRKKAIQVYEDMARYFIENYGTTPTELTGTLYRKALSDIPKRHMAMDEITHSLRECVSNEQPMYLEFDFFKNIYQMQARLLERKMEDSYLCILSINSPEGKKLRKSSISIAMAGLQEILLSELRKSDIISKISSSQFIFLLPMASYENCETVCQRVAASFYRKHSHSPVKIESTILPIEAI